MLYHIAVQVTGLNSNHAKPLIINIPTSLPQVQHIIRTIDKLYASSSIDNQMLTYCI
jgi:hypothetical protein